MTRDSERVERGAAPAPRGPRLAQEGVRGPGEALPDATRQAMESRFGASFADVRIHTDRAADDGARAIGARAFTIGRHVAFADGQFVRGGERLLAHELAHAEQQRETGDGVRRDASIGGDSHEAVAEQAADRVAHDRPIPAIAALAGGPRVQADKPKAAPAAAEKPVGPTLNIVMRAPDDAYTQDVTQYLENTLGESVVAVDNIAEAVQVANDFAKANQVKVGKVRLIGHGTTSGGIRMTPTGETGRRFVTAEELEKMSADAALRKSADQAMADGATVEFWGCYIGRSAKSTAAVSDIFQSDVKAIDATLRTRHETFVRPADAGEAGQAIPGRKGTWIDVTASEQIDSRVASGNKALGAAFNSWLRAQGQRLEAGGELPPQPDDAARIATMREIFDRSGGTIKRAQIESGGKDVDRSNRNAWAKKWKTTKVK